MCLCDRECVCVCARACVHVRSHTCVCVHVQSLGQPVIEHTTENKRGSTGTQGCLSSVEPASSGREYGSLVRPFKRTVVTLPGVVRKLV